MTVSTFYSDTADGLLESANAVYLTALAGSGIGVDTSSSSEDAFGQTLSGGVYYLAEMFLKFDTSAIGTDEVSAAVLSIYGQTDSSVTDFLIECAAYPWTTPLTSADWRTNVHLSAMTIIASLTTAGLSVAGYNDLVSSGLAAAVNTSGTSRFVVFSQRTRTATAPSGPEYVKAWYGDEGGSKRPKLVVTHAAPAGGSGGYAPFAGGGFYP